MPRTALIAAFLAALALGGCSLKQSNDSGGLSAPPPSGAKSSDKSAAQQLGFPVTATRNTTRVSGSDAVADAAGVASALFPASDASNRPPAVVLVDKGDWQGVVAAGAVVGPPINAPILLTNGSSLPAVTSDTIKRLGPRRALLVGQSPSPPSGVQSALIRAGSDHYAEAAAVDHYAAVARGKPSGDVVVTTGEQPGYAMPAAAWAARSGDAVLFVKRDSIPKPTLGALREHQRPRIWVLGPESVVSTKVVRQLGALGAVRRIASGNTPVDSAIAFARFKSGAFGWGASVPGQNLTLANVSRPADAAAAAGLGANGIFAPLLVTDQANALPRSLEGYLLDVQPGFESGNPGQGVFNHVWILGSADAISQQAQARVDTDAALIPVDQSK